MLKSFYLNIVFKYTNTVLIFLLSIFIFFGFYATKLEIDASTETLLLEEDKDLVFSQLIAQRYKTQDILVITYTPNHELLSSNSLKTLENLSNELEKLNTIKSTLSILNVPLLQSPIVKISELINNIKTLKSKDINKTLVKNEFLTSPLYANNLVSQDFKTTALILNLKNDQKYIDFIEKRKMYRKKENNNTLLESEQIEFQTLKVQLKQYRDILRIQNHNNIQKIRAIIKNHSSDARIFLGGINMISDDIISFVKNDLYTYGIALFFILAFVLYIIFKKIIWLILPLFISLLSVIATSGALGLFSWEITVISSNFIAMQLIITLSLVIHLIVRYNELISKYTKSSQRRLLLNTVLSKSNPSFFAIITTVAGFSSLILSDIQPVIQLGYMMSVGILLSLLITFVLFPVILLKFKKIYPIVNKHSKNNFTITGFTANLVRSYPKQIFIISFAIIIISAFGSSKLIVENSFISYFKQDTSIYKSMKVIDTKLGGTTPLDIIITFNDNNIDVKSLQNIDTTTQEDEEEDSFDDEYDTQDNQEQYWFTNEKMEKIMKVHDYLDNLEEIGNVQSFATLLKVAKTLNDNKELDSFALSIIYNKLPLEYQNMILKPYINIQENQVRFSTRIVDSNEKLRRNILIKKIQNDLNNMLIKDKVRLSNVMVLYNNMLQSLFQSQIKTLGFVALILLVMFLILFKSIKIAIISLIANIIPIGIVFAIMGFAKIPLDIMTITIAAISIGIGVDDTIHYVHRFKQEFLKDKNYLNAMQRTHYSIGNAMTYTSISIILGFLILVLSNLIPTIYFGILTVLVMISILASALILLPLMLVKFKVYN